MPGFAERVPSAERTPLDSALLCGLPAKRRPERPSFDAALISLICGSPLWVAPANPLLARTTP